MLDHVLMVAASRTTATDETLAITGKVFEDGSCVETYQPTKSNMEPETFIENDLLDCK